MNINDHGVLHLQGARTLPPPNWLPTEDPQVFVCKHGECLHRRYSHRIEGGQVTVKLHCFAKRDVCPGTCESQVGLPDETEFNGQLVRIHDDALSRDRDKSRWTPDMPAPPPPVQPRPDLHGVLDTLPPHVEGRDRKFIIEEDGCIVYEKGDDWEPPRDINGYARDKKNKWRFIPLWPVCRLRAQIGVRYQNCGCIGIVMKCNCPAHPKFMNTIKVTDCLECNHRHDL